MSAFPSSAEPTKGYASHEEACPVVQIKTIGTEQRNPNTLEIDRADTAEILRLMNEEDKKVAPAVEQVLPQVEKAVDVIYAHMRCGGRLIYCGCGTSGRLGVLDASECPPTYGVSADTVIGIIAGGRDAAFESIEDAEDDFDSCVKQMKEKGFCGKDVCVGLSASGSANCVKGALQYAASLSAKTISVSCNHNSPLLPLSDIAITVEVGPEVINGSTRMKAGTAQKMILNMLSTGAMVRFGRTRGNYMAYMIPSNIKLVDRAVRIICAKTGATPERAKAELEKAGNVIADAIDAIEAEA